MSVGGGYCDCGDPEAWKTEAFCENHAKGLAASEEGREKLMARMPPDVMGRTKIVFATVLKYAYQILTSELTMNLPQDLQVTVQIYMDSINLDALEVGKGSSKYDTEGIAPGPT